MDSRFDNCSERSAADVARVLREPSTRAARMAELLEEARAAYQSASSSDSAAVFLPARILHTLGSAVEEVAGSPSPACGVLFRGLAGHIGPRLQQWLAEHRLALQEHRPAGDWVRQARTLAFECLQQTIVASGEASPPPSSSLRSDEIVWGRSPARLDLAGGWTDTPPFSLENGGCVVNAAVELNGQPPIQVYARVTSEPLIRIHSIDLGTDVAIRAWDELTDYRSATGEFSLVKAALGLAGFAPDSGAPEGRSLPETLRRFGGGLELTTLAAVPKGSGLGTSSIMGAVVLAVVHRMLGRQLSPRELFHAVLRLEQSLTTGGGWQDQIGGVLDGVKLIATQPGLVPDPVVRFIPPDVLAPGMNGGQTLLYYTGITRLAKNILAQVVARYLDRHGPTLATLRAIRALAPETEEAMARKDLRAFGEGLERAWQLNKDLDPNSTNESIEALLAQVRPHLHGAKLLGAGGGGFLLMVARSPADALEVKCRLQSNPPNPRARFFDFDISRQGLGVTVC